MALSTRRRNRSYPSPITNFDDSNRENYIARSSGIGSLKPMGTIVDYNLGKGGRDPSMIGGFGLGKMDPVIEVPTGGPVDMFGQDRSGTTLDMLLDDIFQESIPEKSYRDYLDRGLEAMPNPDEVSGLFGPGPGLGDPTGEGGIIQKLGEFLGLTDPIDPENEGLPMDEYQEYRDRGLQPMMDEMAMDDTYSLPNLLQMINDARDAGNVDEIELLTNDLEMMYPGATMDVAELSKPQLDFMNSQMGTPDFYSSYQDYKDAVDAREEKPFLGIFGGQEPATDLEIINKLKETYGTLPFQVPAIV